MKSVLVSRPANADLRESQRGADTMPSDALAKVVLNVAGGKEGLALKGSQVTAPFWIRMLRLFLMSRSLSSTTRRKESGRTS